MRNSQDKELYCISYYFDIKNEYKVQSHFVEYGVNKSHIEYDVNISPIYMAQSLYNMGYIEWVRSNNLKANFVYLFVCLK